MTHFNIYVFILKFKKKIIISIFIIFNGKMEFNIYKYEISTNEKSINRSQFYVLF